MTVLKITLFVPILAGLLSADTVILKNGDRLQGTFLGGTARQIRLDTPNGQQTIEIERVESIRFDDSGAPVASGRPEMRRPPAAQADSAPPRDYPVQQPAYNGGLTIPADTTVEIRMIDSVDSERTRLGQTFRASLDEPIVVNGQQVVPRGADVICKLVDDKQSGKIEGRTVLTLALQNIQINGRLVDVTSTDVTEQSSSRGARSAKVVGGTAALGAIIGAIAGGGKGAAIGAGSGAAVGTGAQVLTKGQTVKIPSETRLTFRLQQPVQI
jgi:hypothetical protein